MTDQPADISVGDRVLVTDKNVEGEVVDIREFNGRKTYVVDTERGSRVVVGMKQIEKLS